MWKIISLWNTMNRQVFSRIESYMQQLPTRPRCDINCKVSLHKRSPHVIVWGGHHLYTWPWYVIEWGFPLLTSFFILMMSSIPEYCNWVSTSPVLKLLAILAEFGFRHRTYHGLVQWRMSTRADNWCLKVSPTVGLLLFVLEMVCLPFKSSSLTPSKSCQIVGKFNLLKC